MEDCAMTPNLGERLLPPEPCICGAEPLSPHAKDCSFLAAMRAQVFPDVLDDNGRPWYMNRLDAQSSLLKQAADLIFVCMSYAPYDSSDKRALRQWLAAYHQAMGESEEK